ncbi:ead/Ea22-like family protein, partial [Salmonella enterica]|uniref:ead/Ea22-like family protein n=1 Tax=Salmonella enterica TaxID=28901 RepID=UPI003F72157F
MNIEKAKRQLRVMLSGPASGYMECATAVKAILDELEATEKRIAEQREYYEGVIADGSKRIAELENGHQEAAKQINSW